MWTITNASDRATGRRKRWAASLAVLASLTSMASMAAVLAVPAPASADAPPGVVRCADYPDVGWVKIRDAGPFSSWEGFREYQLISATPTFEVAEARISRNELPTEATVTFTSTVAQTFTAQVSIGVTAKFTDFLSSTVSVQITVSQTTTIGFSHAAKVPPFSAAIGEYGVEGYDVVFTAQRFTAIGSRTQPLTCIAWDRVQGTGKAPTRILAWRVRPI